MIQTSEAEYFQQFRGDRNPIPDIPAMLQEYEALKARGFPKVTEEFINGRWIVTIHQLLNVANPWEGSEAKAVNLQDAQVEAMIPYQENTARYLDWIEGLQ